jgi:fatty acid desaturase
MALVMTNTVGVMSVGHDVVTHGHATRDLQVDQLVGCSAWMPCDAA